MDKKKSKTLPMHIANSLNKTVMLNSISTTIKQRIKENKEPNINSSKAKILKNKKINLNKQS